MTRTTIFALAVLSLVASAAASQDEALTAHSMLTRDGRRLVSRRVGGKVVRELVPTNALDGEWKPVTEFLPVADFTVDRIKTDSAAFYKIEVSDVD